MSRKSITSGQIELSEIGLSFSWFQWGCVKYFLKANLAKIAVFEVKCEMCVLACRLDLGGHMTNCKVDDVVGL